jgi:hypothetical protein
MNLTLAHILLSFKAFRELPKPILADDTELQALTANIIHSIFNEETDRTPAA